MKKNFRSIAVIIATVALIIGCKKDASVPVAATEEISQETLSQVKSLGFGISTLQKVEGGYLVEGDILLTPEHLKSKPATQFLRIGKEEQYRIGFAAHYYHSCFYCDAVNLYYCGKRGD